MNAITADRLDDLYERLATAAHIADTLMCAPRRHAAIVAVLRDLCAGDITPDYALTRTAG